MKSPDTMRHYETIMTTPRDCPIVLFLFSLVMAACLGSIATDAAELPNIVLTMGDDHGWFETGYNNHPHLKTPVLDEMAATGLRLDRFYSAHPSCSPTRGSCMTGRHPNRYGTFAPNWSSRPDEIGIAKILSDAGYACGHFGKWHLGPVKADSPTSPKAFGFEEWLSHDNFFEMNPKFSRNGGAPETYSGESSEVLVRESLRFIAKAKQDKRPFFVVIWFGSPHEPYSGLESDLETYSDLPDVYAERKVSLTSMTTGKATKRPQRDVLQERFAEITAMDRAIGILRTQLKREKMWRNTLHWYCGDNGVPAHGQVDSTPFRGAKGLMYEGGIRVPGVIEWPAGIAKPRASTVNTVTSDILPTLCGIVGAPLPKRPLDGLNLQPLISGEMKRRREPICFWSYDTRRLGNDLEPYIPVDLQKGTTPLVKIMAGRFTRNFRNVHQPPITDADYAGPRVILDGRYKLVIGQSRKNGKPQKELFDLQTDPSEKNNLLEAKAVVAQSLDANLHEWQSSVLQSLSGADYR